MVHKLILIHVTILLTTVCTRTDYSVPVSMLVTLCPLPPSGLQGTTAAPMHFQRNDSIVGSPAKPFLIGRSRLETEFEELEVIGSGGFGDVIKVGGAGLIVSTSHIFSRGAGQASNTKFYIKAGVR